MGFLLSYLISFETSKVLATPSQQSQMGSAEAEE